LHGFYKQAYIYTYTSSTNTMQAASDVFANAFEEDQMSIQDLKGVLMDTLYGTERGLSADSDTRAEVLELISQLEARNPTPEPNEADGLGKLAGTWKLVYTSNSELIPLLALGRLPLVEVGEVTQTIDAASMSVENSLQLSVPFSRTSLGATAAFEVRSPKLLQVQFNEGRVATPELLSDFELPATVDVLGQTVDLTLLQNALRPLDEPVKAVVERLGSLLAGAPDLRLPIQSGNKSATWLLNTYLDDDLRIARGDGGSVFVLARDSEVVSLMEVVETNGAEGMAPHFTEVVVPDAVVEPAGSEPEEPSPEP
jgi:hypothetical protein